jgi:hypothetical protein
VKPIESVIIKYYLVFGIVFVIFVAFLFTVSRGGLWLKYWNAYRVEIVILFGFFGFYVLSVATHVSAYANGFEMVNYGARSIMLYSVVFMTWVIFSERTASESTVPALMIMIGLNVVAILQFFSYDSVRWLTLLFVSSDATNLAEKYPNLHGWGGASRVISLFRWHTIYGVVAGLLVVYVVGKVFFNKTDRMQKVLLVGLGSVSFLGGSLSESKNFFLTLGIGLLAMLFKLHRSQRRAFIGVAVGAVVIFHTFAWFSPNLASQWSDGLPYLEKIQEPENVGWQDFVPKIDILTGRPVFWGRAVELWKEEKWLGIGPGVYKLESGFERRYNTHNLFIQTLTDVGLVGIAILILLLFRIGKRIRDPVKVALFFATLVSQLFDYFLDYSIGFVLILSWLLSKSSLDSIGKSAEKYP